MPDSSRRDFLRLVTGSTAALALPIPRLEALDPDARRLGYWCRTLRDAGLTGPRSPLGPSVIRTGELAQGSPYRPYMLEAYLRDGGDPRRTEPLAVSLSAFDCVTLVESAIAVARTAADPARPSWNGFGREVERVRYRDGKRRDYSSRLHYFSEWISDGARRGLVRDLGAELDGIEDARPLRFMTEHRASYPALANNEVFARIAEIQRRLDGRPRIVVPTARVPAIADRIESGDVLAFATSIAGLDVTHAALAHRGTDGVLGVLHAPLSGGVVEVARATLPEYVAAIRRCTGILVARPLRT